MKCPLCLTNEANHCHHVVPQCNGGKDGPTVMLCGGCHTDVHSISKTLIAGKPITKHKQKKGDAWMYRAQHYIRLIVGAADNVPKDKLTKVQILFTNNEHAKVKELARKAGLSMTEYCHGAVISRLRG